MRVAGARNLAEAEFIQGLLLEEGVPSLLRRSAGFDVPDMLAAGPRDVLVPKAGEPTAREVLLEAELISAEPAATRPVAPGTAAGGHDRRLGHRRARGVAVGPAGRLTAAGRRPDARPLSDLGGG